MTSLRLFAPCPRGLEQPLAEELAAIGARIDATVAAGVAFSADRRTAYAANLHCRIPSRILLRVAEGNYRDDDDLYRLANRCEWERWFDIHRTLRIDVNASRSPLRSLNFATLRLKDGLVDRFRSRTGERPSINTAEPDVRIFCHLDARGATLYLDLSGEPLFKRGWRSERDDKGEAPLKENLAAGLLALAGWRAGMPLVDPFCGSGTIVIEAAQQTLGIAPGLSRGFGFERLLDFDSACWTQLRTEALERAQQARRAAALPIAASDIDGQALEQIRRNAARAGLPEHAIRSSRLDARDLQPPFPGPGLIVTNPPYGERISLRGAPRQGTRIVTTADDAGWRDIGRALRERFDGWQLWILSSEPELPRRLGMKARRRTPLYNGAIECRFFGFEIFAPGQVPQRRGANDA